ncbi:flavin reductase like domain-containing protein [Hypoxylon trugodes]|uniref:flavin reductase like domain-containing protein n=1 Tax=Hypoxylon trugodes TaxID=326681 RepID=UPI00219EC449|nr:flavin reductase like domain-containing protein [Hypoxylon trugodes]KAI1390522.1 flavin reductase like domain-containing protein [Hypoxylon trugodes]
MKIPRGLRWTFKSAKPRNVSFLNTTGAPVSFSTKSSLGGAEGQARAATTPQSQDGETSKRPVKPAQHALSSPLRAVMRQLPHPVVVITTLETPAEANGRAVDRLPRPIPRAMTVSSFTSLSIDPVPRVTFNVTLPSTTHQALVQSRRFNAHILSGDDHGARIADLFTRGNRASEDTDLGVLAGLEKLGAEILGREQWLQEWESGENHRKISLARGNASTGPDTVRPSTLPVFRGPGILHVLKCRYHHLKPPVDCDFDHHAIIMGEVLDIISGEATGDGDIALAYADRAYRQMGRKLLKRPATD